ncbi:adenylate kinase [Vibrio chagasii]|uniref:adenylate kinase n=1 Tax=Vibrio chagasii TaxID=170679 RepID=UPI003DA0E172
MKKIAVFGKPGSGKSTVSKALAAATGLELHQLDSIVYKANGEFVDSAEFEQAHDSMLSSDSWIIDGFGPLDSFNKRLDAADTLVYIDPPYPVSYWFVTKRLLKGLFVKPEGWPDGSSVIKGTIQSYKMLKLSPSFWNDDFRSRLELRAKEQDVHIIRSVSELNSFVRNQVTG